MDDRTLKRFLAKIAPDDNGCWIWTAARNPGNGYARFYGAKSDPQHSSTVAHRVAYEHYVGVIPVDRELDHLCRVRHCVNPDHVEVVTRLKNVIRSSKVTLSVTDVRYIRDQYESGDQSTTELATLFGLTYSGIKSIVNRRTWSHVS